MTALLSRIKYVVRFAQRFGLWSLCKALVSRGLFKSLRASYNFRIHGPRYPAKTIFIVGFGKSGSTWFAKLMASLQGFDEFTPLKWHTGELELNHDLYPGFVKEFDGKLAVVKGHTIPTTRNLELLEETGLKYFITVRDPRDVLISSYWYYRNDKFHGQHQLALSMTLGEFIDLKLQGDTFEKEFLGFVEGWLSRRNPARSKVIVYEKLLQDTGETVRDCCDFLEYKITQLELQKIVEKNNFNRVSGRKPGQENTANFLRKGIAGECHDIFTGEQLGIANRKCLISLGKFNLWDFTG